MSVKITNSTRVVKARDLLQITLTRGFWQPSSVHVAWWQRLPGISKYVTTVSQVPVGADKSAVVDVRVNQLGNGKSYGQIAADLDFSPWGPDVTDIKPLVESDLRASVAPARITSAEATGAQLAAKNNPLAQIFNLSSTLTKVGALVAVAVILFYVAPFLTPLFRKKS